MCGAFGAVVLAVSPFARTALQPSRGGPAEPSSLGGAIGFFISQAASLVFVVIGLIIIGLLAGLAMMFGYLRLPERVRSAGPVGYIVLVLALVELVQLASTPVPHY
jgi:hypothetical protein